MCVFVWHSGLALDQGILTVAGNPMESVKGYSLAFCEFNCNTKCKSYEIWEMFATQPSLLFYLVGLSMSRTLNLETPPSWETVMVGIYLSCPSTLRHANRQLYITYTSIHVWI